MISFSKLGDYGRLGNQLFQYAFIRTQAERLGVKFFCPSWIGDKIFYLNDKAVKSKSNKTNKIYYEQEKDKKYDSRVLNIQDNTEFRGFFQTEKYFDKSQAKIWFSFNKDKIKRVKEKYKSIDFSKCVGIHLRFGDKAKKDITRIIFYLPNLSFYKKALKIVGEKRILVFSDEPERAREYFKNLKLKIDYISGNTDWEDLYLMTQCKDLICCGSTFSWWGAWLNNYSDKKIIVPREGQFRPGSIFKNKDYWLKEWIKIRGLCPVTGHFFIADFPRGIMFNMEASLGKAGSLLRKINPIFDRLIKWLKK